MLKFLEQKIRRVPDFPKKGILFYDITPVLQDAKAFKTAIDLMCNLITNELGDNFDKVASIESRGFILGSAVAYTLNKGFVMVRKEGKLPYETLSYSYGLEYGTATCEIHIDAISKGEKVVVIDDLIATGGTAVATAKLVRELGGNVIGALFLIELTSLEGRKELEKENIKVLSILKY